MSSSPRVEVTCDADVALVRRAVRTVMTPRDSETAYFAELIATELATNALLHGGGIAVVAVKQTDDGVRIEVADRSRRAPLVGLSSVEAMTGRGLSLVVRLATRWGIEPTEEGKVIWADVVEGEVPKMVPPDDVLAAFHDPWSEGAPARVRVSLGAVPTDLLVAAKRHVDNLVREFTLASAGDRSRTTAPIPAPLADLIDRVVHRFEEARLEIKRQATAAARQAATHTNLELDLSIDAADAAEEYLGALDEVDSYSRANRLLTLETPPQHRVFRHWYVGEIVKQLRAAAAGNHPPAVVPFEDRLLAEVDAAEEGRRAADRAARLYSVAVALASAVTPEEVASAVLRAGVSALGASGGGVLLATEHDRFEVPATIGYDEPVVEKLRQESRDADLPAAYALRTGEAVWLETVEERNARFPALVGFEPDTTAICAVPLGAGDEVVGALRFSFTDRRLFDDDEQRFVLALAAEAAEALQRARLLEDRARVAATLQQSLLPAALPAIAGLDLGAVYAAAGAGVGGDFYDVFPLSGERWGLAMGDVRGRGPQAAATTALVRYTIRTAALLGCSPGDVCRVANDAMGQDDDPERFCSAVYACLEVDAEGARLTYANAGHPPPAVLRDGGVEYLAPTGGLLGILRDTTFGERTLDLRSGESLVLYTDGVSEARSNGEELGEARLDELLLEVASRSAQAIAEAVTDEARAFAGAGATDDAAVFVVSVR